MNIRLLIGFICMGVGFVFMPISSYKSTNAVESVMGRVISSQSAPSHSSGVFYVNYGYSVGGKSYLGQEGVPLPYSGGFPAGKSIKVNYFSSSPDNSTLYELSQPLPLFLIFAGVALLGIYLFFVPKDF